MMLSNLRLHRDIERRRRLVADQELGWVASARAIENALALAARELMRKLLGVASGQAHRAQQFADA